jgi:hypothetical protein
LKAHAAEIVRNLAEQPEPMVITPNGKEAFSNLSDLPERGADPKELLALGIREHREIFFKPYHIIYRIIK